MNFPKLQGKAFLAPLSGVTDVAFRAVAVKHGASFTCTEFVNSSAIIRGSKATMDLLKTDKIEKPVAVQIFGNDPKKILQAAETVKNKFDVIDLNCGCPDKKIVESGAGSELLKSPKMIYEIVSMLTSLNKPITVKMRTGIRDDKKSVEIARLIEKAGASAITVHGRTQKQSYNKPANWDAIKKIKAELAIPVIGNGDVSSPEIFKKRLEESKVDYIAIGRAAIGNPSIFDQINAYLENDDYQKDNNVKIFFEYLKLAKKYKLPFHSVKRQAMYFTKGANGATKTRALLMNAKSIDQIEDFMVNLI